MTLTHSPLRRALRGALMLALVSRVSAATGGGDPFDAGVAQFARGGAWLATGSDPIAAYYNPAALVTQPTSAYVGAELVFQKVCYERRGPGNSDASYSVIGLPYAEVCNDDAARPDFLPNFALAFRARENLAFGAAVTVSAPAGSIAFADQLRVRGADGFERSIPAPQRYLTTAANSTLIVPTLALAYAVNERLSLGAGFVWGVAVLELSYNVLAQVSPTQTTTGDEASADFRSTLRAKDVFVPGFVVGALYSASENVDLAGWYRYSDAIRAEGDLDLVGPYYTNFGQPRPRCGSGAPPCAETTHSEDQLGKDAVRLRMVLPMQARIGIRWHLPQQRAPQPLMAERFRRDAFRVRDPLRDDLYDVELDLGWTNNSAADSIEVRLPRAIQVDGTGNVFPANADQQTGYKDRFDARVGGQYALVRNQLGLRLGTWIETPGAKAEFLAVTGVPGLRGGAALGFVLRVQSVDVEAAYGRIWNAGLDNRGDGQSRAIAGSSTEPTGFAARSYHSVNGGSVTESTHVIALGAVTRF